MFFDFTTTQKTDGKDAFCGVTQFESTDARRAFPCWDEPGCKATFELEMTYPKDLICLSNTEPVGEPKVNGDNATIKFEKTPKMSTYLLAWAVGQFEYVEGKTSENNIRVRVYTTMGNKAKGQFACEVGCRCLDFYEKLSVHLFLFVLFLFLILFYILLFLLFF